MATAFGRAKRQREQQQEQVDFQAGMAGRTAEPISVPPINQQPPAIATKPKHDGAHRSVDIDLNDVGAMLQRGVSFNQIQQAGGVKRTGGMTYLANQKVNPKRLEKAMLGGDVDSFVPNSRDEALVVLKSAHEMFGEDVASKISPVMYDFLGEKAKAFNTELIQYAQANPDVAIKENREANKTRITALKDEMKQVAAAEYMNQGMDPKTAAKKANRFVHNLRGTSIAEIQRSMLPNISDRALKRFKAQNELIKSALSNRTEKLRGDGQAIANANSLKRGKLIDEQVTGQKISNTNARLDTAQKRYDFAAGIQEDLDKRRESLLRQQTSVLNMEGMKIQQTGYQLDNQGKVISNASSRIDIISKRADIIGKAMDNKQKAIDARLKMLPMDQLKTEAFNGNIDAMIRYNDVSKSSIENDKLAREVVAQAYDADKDLIKQRLASYTSEQMTDMVTSGEAVTYIGHDGIEQEIPPQFIEENYSARADIDLGIKQKVLDGLKIDQEYANAIATDVKTANVWKHMKSGAVQEARNMRKHFGNDAGLLEASDEMLTAIVEATDMGGPAIAALAHTAPAKEKYNIAVDQFVDDKAVGLQHGAMLSHLLKNDELSPTMAIGAMAELQNTPSVHSMPDGPIKNLMFKFNEEVVETLPEFAGASDREKADLQVKLRSDENMQQAVLNNFMQRQVRDGSGNTVSFATDFYKRASAAIIDGPLIEATLLPLTSDPKFGGLGDVLMAYKADFSDPVSGNYDSGKILKFLVDGALNTPDTRMGKAWELFAGQDIANSKDNGRLAAETYVRTLRKNAAEIANRSAHGQQIMSGIVASMEQQFTNHDNALAPILGTVAVGIGIRAGSTEELQEGWIAKRINAHLAMIEQAASDMNIGLESLIDKNNRLKTFTQAVSPFGGVLASRQSGEEYNILQDTGHSIDTKGGWLEATIPFTNFSIRDVVEPDQFNNELDFTPIEGASTEATVDENGVTSATIYTGD